MKNFDYNAAKSGNEILKNIEPTNAKEFEKFINDTLLVLHNNGVYACILYLYAKGKKKNKSEDKKKNIPINNIVKELLNIVDTALGIKFEDLENKIDKSEDILNFVNDNICNNSDILFLVKDLWERTLIYARYGAKAKVKDNELEDV